MEELGEKLLEIEEPRQDEGEEDAKSLATAPPSSAPTPGDAVGNAGTGGMEEAGPPPDAQDEMQPSMQPNIEHGMEESAADGPAETPPPVIEDYLDPAPEPFHEVKAPPLAEDMREQSAEGE